MIWLSQHRVCSLAAIICGALCLTLLFIPGLIFWLFQIPHDVSGVIISRRAAMLFAGLGYLAWSTRHLIQSAATRAIFRAFVVAMGGLALLGSIEFLRGAVGPGIVLAIGAESFFALAFARLSSGST